MIILELKNLCKKNSNISNELTSTDSKIQKFEIKKKNNNNNNNTLTTYL